MMRVKTMMIFGVILSMLVAAIPAVTGEFSEMPSSEQTCQDSAPAGNGTNPGGNGTNPGGDMSNIVVDPLGGGNFTTIQAAVDAADYGANINVSAGTYYESVTVDKTVTLMGEGNGVTTLEEPGTGGFGFKVTADWVNITGFAFANAADRWNRYGVSVEEADHVSVTDCDVYDGRVGISYEDSDLGVVADNRVADHHLVCISLYKSENNTVTRNILRNNFRAIGIGGNNNTVSDNVAQNSSSYGIQVGSCSGNVIEDNTVTNNSDGVLMWGAETNLIKGNDISGNRAVGLMVWNSPWNHLWNNTMVNNTLYGIKLQNSKTSMVEGNDISLGQVGVAIESSDSCVIRNNTITGVSQQALRIGLSTSTVIYANNLYYNDWSINFIGNSDKNSFYHNNVVAPYAAPCNAYFNLWDNDLGEGSYWLDYDGDDNGAKKRVAGDGIGDTGTPYGMCDSYPFMEPWGWLTMPTPVMEDPGGHSTDGRFDLTWAAVRGTVRYILEEDSSPDFTSPDRVYTGKNPTFTASGSFNGTHYYRVRAIGTWVGSEWSTVVDMSVDWLPPAPQNLTAVAGPAGNTVTVAWVPNTVDTVSYELEHRTDGDFVQLTSTRHPEASYIHKDLTDGVGIVYRVRAVDDAGQYSAYSAEATAMPADLEAPAPPTGLSAEAVAHDTIILTWDVSQEADASGYNLYRIAAPDSMPSGDPVNGDTPLTTPEYADTGLSEASEYNYVVTAMDEVPNESGPSEAASAATPLAPRPPELGETIGDLLMDEDIPDSTSINMLAWFSDPNGDELTFSCSGQEKLDVHMDEETGVVTLTPEAQWSGVERLEFTASDGESETSDTVRVRVRPVNDPPGRATILSPSAGHEVDEGFALELTGQCDDPDLPYGDSLTYAWSSDVTGLIGKGVSLVSVDLPPGGHEITLSVWDKAGEISEASVRVTVNELAVDEPEEPMEEAPEEPAPQDGGDEETGDPEQVTPPPAAPEKSTDDASDLRLAIIMTALLLFSILVNVFLVVRKKKNSDPKDKNTSENAEPAAPGQGPRPIPIAPIPQGAAPALATVPASPAGRNQVPYPPGALAQPLALPAPSDEKMEVR